MRARVAVRGNQACGNPLTQARSARARLRDKELVLLSFLVAIISRRLPLSEFHQAARERLRLRQIAGCRRGLLRPLAAFRRADITVFGNPL